jgi:pimeloyl-ACP methyl ester carboxylesterase
MAEHINGPLYYERMGRSGPVIAFVHPNPMDQSCWLYQMAHFSTWFRCIAIDIPGYGKSPTATEGLTLDDIGAGCWEAIDDALPGESAVLVGCSVGSAVVPHMYHLRPERSNALVMCGTGYTPVRENPSPRAHSYAAEGVDFRWRYTFQDLSPAFGATPMAHYFAQIFTERNDFADVPTIIHQFHALTVRDEPENFHATIGCPSIILTGSEDNAHPRSFALQERIPGCELRVLPGAGHACQLEQPWLFDRFMIEFLTVHGLFPGAKTLAAAL